MTRPSFRLRLLRWVLRLLVRPRLRWTIAPERTEREFEVFSRLMFGRAKGAEICDKGTSLRVTASDATPDQVILYIHGGGFLSGSPECYSAFGAKLSAATGCQVWLARYPLLQRKCFPAAPDAVLQLWDELIDSGYRPDQIVLMGDSAGGNLVFGLLSRVLQRGQRPRAVVGFSPWLDMTLSGSTFKTSIKTEDVIPVERMGDVVERYLNGAEPSDPLASPLFATFPDAPPVLLMVGAGEIMLSDAERMARYLGAQLQVWPDCPHGWQLFAGRLPEADAALKQVASFLHTSFAVVKRNPTASATWGLRTSSDPDRSAIVRATRSTR